MTVAEVRKITHFNTEECLSSHNTHCVAKKQRVWALKLAETTCAAQALNWLRSTVNQFLQ